MWLDRGQVVIATLPRLLISEYLKASTINQTNAADLKGKGTGEARLTGARLPLDSDGQVRIPSVWAKRSSSSLTQNSFVPYRLFSCPVVKRADTALPILHLATTDSELNPEEDFRRATTGFASKYPNVALSGLLQNLSFYLGFQLKDLVHVEYFEFFHDSHGYSKRTTHFIPI